MEDRIIISMKNKFIAKKIFAIILIATVLISYGNIPVSYTHLTKFMFTENENIDVLWKPISDLSARGSGMVDGSTRVDAYNIENKMCIRDRL